MTGGQSVDVPHLKLLQLCGDQTLSLGQRSVTPLDALMDLRHGVWAATATVCTAAEHATLRQRHTQVRHARERHDAAPPHTTCEPTCIFRIWSLSRVWTIFSTSFCMRAWCASAISVRSLSHVKQRFGSTYTIQSILWLGYFTLLELRSPPFKHGPRYGEDYTTSALLP